MTTTTQPSNKNITGSGVNGTNRKIVRNDKEAANKGYKGTGKKSKDSVFESKREQYETRMTELDAEVAKCRSKLSQLSEQISSIMHGESNKGARGELRTKMQVLKSQKESLEIARAPIFGHVKDLQDQMKRKIEELNAAKEKLPFKRTEEIDKKIRDLEHQLETGSVEKLIDEKRMVAEVTKLKKNRKAIEALSSQQHAVDDLKREMDVARAALSEKEHAINAIRDQLRQLSGQLNALPDDRNSKNSKIQALISEKEEAKKRLDHLQGEKSLCFTDFQAAREAHREWIEQDRLRKDELFKRREIEEELGKLEAEMESLDLPPCADQIVECVNIQSYLKGNILKTGELVSSSAHHSTSSQSIIAGVPTLQVRQVEKVDSDLILKNKFTRDDEDTFYFTGMAPTKKSGKSSQSKKSTLSAGSAEVQRLKLPFWVVSGLEELGVGIVTSMAEVEAAVSKLDAIKADFEKKQQAQLKPVDGQRAAIQAKINQQKSRLDNVAAEVAAARAKAAEQQGQKSSLKSPKQALSSPQAPIIAAN